MKENPSPGPRKQHAPKRPVVALVVMTVVALSFALLLASGGQTYAASASSASDATPLAVSLTVPPNGYPNNVINTPITLIASVTTSGPNETIAKVEFYYSTAGSTPTLIGTQQVAAYGYYDQIWTPSAPGTYSFIAKAYDTFGNVATSTPVTASFVVPTPSPALTVTVTSPSNGSVYTLPAQIPLKAGIGGVVGTTLDSYTIEYYATLEPNGPTYGVGGHTGVGPPIFTATWVPSQAGTYSLVAKVWVIDEAGYQSGTSAPITVQVNASSCSVNYQVESQWSGGFSANVVLTNTSSVPIHDWTLAFTFPGDQQITELWNGSFAQTGEQVTITNLSYNSSIAPGGTVNLGFNGAWVSNDTSPMLFTLNGMTCST